LFRNPVMALAIIRELGLQTDRFSLEAWRPDEVELERQAGQTVPRLYG
jgi:hypothetical protein